MRHCFHSPTKVVEIDGIQYYCADKGGVAEFKGDAVLNLSGRQHIPQFDIPELDAEVEHQYEELLFAWPDFGVPHIKPTFWAALHRFVKAQGWSSVCIHCEGGHGRTGTAIVALMMSVGSMDLVDAVGEMRRLYCRYAIETPEQIDYLRELYFWLSGDKIEDEILSGIEIAVNEKEAEDRAKMCGGSK